ncbi:MAG: substrate-binding domain-containing protein [Kiritimatiellae bacterium]|nr:substrate-binding domain-containing protein [Kiritimatiellia bacterium]
MGRDPALRPVAALCEKAGKPCHVFPGRAEEEVRSRAGRLSAWLAGLPAHVAIFAANDFTAKGVVEAAAGLHLRCPRDFTLVGVDAIPETLADMTSPGISSVELDFELAGYLAAKLLDAEISRAGSPMPSYWATPLQSSWSSMPTSRRRPRTIPSSSIAAATTAGFTPTRATTTSSSSGSEPSAA